MRLVKTSWKNIENSKIFFKGEKTNRKHICRNKITFKIYFPVFNKLKMYLSILSTSDIIGNNKIFYW